MANRVQVEFGASIGQLQSAVNSVNSSLDSIKGHVESVGNAFSALAALAGVGLSFEGLKSAFDGLSAYADEIQNAQARMGGTLEDMTTLHGIAEMSGVSFQSLTRAVADATTQLQKASSDAYGPAAQGLKSLGLSAKELSGLPTDQWFEKVSDAVSRFNPSLNLTSNVQAALGRGMAELMPLLLQGSDNFRELQASVQKAQEGLSAALPGISETEDKLNLLSLRSRAFAAQVFTTLKPAIEAAIDAFSSLTGSISNDDIRDAANRIANALIDIAAAVARFFVQAGVTVDALKAKLADGFKLDLNLGGVEADSPIIKYLFTPLAKATGQYDQLKDRLEHGISFDFNPPASFADRFGAGGAGVDDQVKAIEDAAKRAHDAVNSAIPVSGSWEAMGQGLKQLNKDTLELASSFTKLNAPQLNLGLAQAGRAAMEAAQGQIRAADLAYQNQVEKLQTAATLHQITESQKTRATLAAIDQREEAELSALRTAQVAAGLSVALRQKIEDEITAVIGKAVKDRQKIIDQDMISNVQSWQNALKPIQSAWDSQLRGLLAGTETFSQAMKNVFSQLVLQIIEKLESLAVEKLALNLASMFGDPAALAAGAAKSIAASMGQMYAGEAAFFAPTLGPGAPAAAAAVVGTTQATALGMTGVASLDVGGYVLSDGIAMIHAGETITPASVATPYGGGGGAQLVFAPNVSAFNPSGMQATLRAMMPQLATMLRQYQNINPSTA